MTYLTSLSASSLTQDLDYVCPVRPSGIGRYKGVHGLRSFCNMKSILIDGNSDKIEANWFPYTKRKYELFSGMIEGLFGGGILNFIKFLIYGLKLESYSDKVGKKGRV